MYDDDYGTCERTYVTLCIRSLTVFPEEITQLLDIEPSHWQRIGESPSDSTRRPPAKINGWFLTTEDIVDSRDSRRHIDWLLDQILSKKKEILELKIAGCDMNISCYWLRKSGQGGPSLHAKQIGIMSELSLPLWFDIYGPFERQ